jgi:hypothetical protein
VDEIWPSSLAEMGTFIGGAAGPVAIIWLVGTFFSQRQELAETRRELARQAEAQERAMQASLAQQVIAQLPIASDAIFKRFWPLISVGEGSAEVYATKDLAFVVTRVRLNSSAEVMYGSEESKEREMFRRGAVQALEFAESQILGLSSLADLADPSGALSKLVESTLLRHEIRALRISADKAMGR